MNNPQSVIDNETDICSEFSDSQIIGSVTPSEFSKIQPQCVPELTKNQKKKMKKKQTKEKQTLQFELSLTD